MIGQLGQVALIVGILAAVAAALLWLRVALAGARPEPARRATWLVLGAAAAACAALEWALLAHDFSVRYVAENGGEHVPLYFTVTSLWAALDGSLLLWLLILGGYAAVLARRPRGRTAAAKALQPWAMTVVSAAAVFFFALSYFAANPFGTVSPVPAGGPGPNPLLQEHPAMGLHPPLLYAGYIGLVVPFAYAVAALLSTRSERDWLTASRRWTLLAWCLLTAGIVLGAWWSYAVLGWGGYWAWDPVENAALMPWLTTTALLHSTVAQRKGATLSAWSAGLACASFLLVLVGTFLTRSGVVASVHSFTESPLGPMLLGFVILVALVVIGLIAWRGDRFGSPRTGGRGLSRETAFLGNTVLLVALTAVVLTGTLFPLVSEAFTGSRSAVGPPYYNGTAVPIALGVLVLMGTAPLVRWGGDTAGGLARRLAVPVAVGLATVAVVGLTSRPGADVLAAFGAAGFVLAGIARLAVAQLRRTWSAARSTRHGPLRTAWQRRRRYGVLVAHAGLAVAAIGIAGSSGYTAATEREVAVGGTVTVGDVTARLSDVDVNADGTVATADLRLIRDHDTIGTSHPGLRYYAARDTTVSIPGIHSELTRDVYLTLVRVSDDGDSATIRLAVNPLVGLIWLGGAGVVVGGLLAIGRRSRTPDQPVAKTPTPRKHPAPPQEPAPLQEPAPRKEPAARRGDPVG